MARIIGANGRKRSTVIVTQGRRGGVITTGGTATYDSSVLTPLITAGMRIGGLAATYGATFYG